MLNATTGSTQQLLRSGPSSDPKPSRRQWLVVYHTVFLISSPTAAVEAREESDLPQGRLRRQITVSLASTNKTSTNAQHHYELRNHRTQEAQTQLKRLYTFSYGGPHALPDVATVMNTITRLNYPGLAVQALNDQPAPPSQQRPNLDRGVAVIQYLKFDRVTEGGYLYKDVAAVFMGHKYSELGWSIDTELAVIKHMTSYQGFGTIFWWFEGPPQGGTATVTSPQVLGLVEKVFEAAKKRKIRLLVYPKYKSWYHTIEETLPILQNRLESHPLLGTAFSLKEERLSGKTNERIQQAITIGVVSGKLYAMVVSGMKQTINTALTGRELWDQTNLNLPEIEYDLRPFLSYLRGAQYTGPIFFDNFHLARPHIYLEETMADWDRLVPSSACTNRVTRPIAPCLIVWKLRIASAWLRSIVAALPTPNAPRLMNCVQMPSRAAANRLSMRGSGNLANNQGLLQCSRTAAGSECPGRL